MTKYCPEIVEKIADCIALGNFANVACAFAGISTTTYHEWMNDESKPEFTEAIKEAEAISEIDALAAIRNDPSWQSKAWFLERKFKDRWAKTETQKIVHSGVVESRPVEELTNDELERIASGRS